MVDEEERRRSDASEDAYLSNVLRQALKPYLPALDDNAVVQVDVIYERQKKNDIEQDE